MGCICCKKKNNKKNTLRASLLSSNDDFTNKIQSFNIMGQSKKTIVYADFDSLTLLGIGSFGKVWLVRHRATNSIYAMKILQKECVIEHKQEAHTLTERDILEKIHYPFIRVFNMLFKTQSIYFF